MSAWFLDSELSTCFRVQRAEYISYNTSTHALPNMHALTPFAPLGVMHIYQAKYSCQCYKLYISCHWLLMPLGVDTHKHTEIADKSNLKKPGAHLA